MKRFWALLAFFLALNVQAVEQSAPVSFKLDAVPVSQVLRLVYGEALKTPFVLEPAALQDSRLVSFRWDSGRGEVRPFLVRFLDAMGYVIESRGGVDFVKAKPEAEKPEPEKEVFVYRPKFRDGSYLADILQPAFKGAFTQKRVVQAAAGDKSATGAVPAGSAAALIDRANADTLVFVGSELEVQRLVKLLPQVDVPGGEVLVQATIYEVQTGNTEGSAFQLAASILGGKLSIGYGGTNTLENFIQFKVADVSAIFSALSGDSRFKVVSSPSLRVKSGGSARIVVGQDVPVLGALSFPQGAGQAVQSVEYRSSGIIFSLSPRVRDAVIDLDVTEQVSDFVKTETGVNNSPTLTKRELTTNVTATDGDVLILGGLISDKDNHSRKGFSFLPDFMRASTGEVSRSELLLVLQVKRQ